LAWMRDQTASRALGELGLEEEVWLCHGSPRSDVEYLLETVTKQGVRPATPEEISVRCGERGVSAGLIACAHTHIPRVVRAPGGALVVNPGSVGLPAYDDTSPYHHVMEAGSPHARYAVLERSDSGWLCQLLSIPYDHASMAALAEERGRQDWARALRNGFLS
ncbi:MAG: metallophosphoesterase, partial [Acidobacteriota bacterium]